MKPSPNHPAIKAYFDKNYVVADFTVYERKEKENLEKTRATDLLKKYNNADQGLPRWLVFDNKKNLTADPQSRPQGATLTTKGQNMGYPAAPEEILYFIN